MLPTHTPVINGKHDYLTTKELDPGSLGTIKFTRLQIRNIRILILTWHNTRQAYASTPHVLGVIVTGVPGHVSRSMISYKRALGTESRMLNMYEPALDTLMNIDFIPQADILPFPPAFTQSQTNLAQTYTVIPTEQSNLPHVGGPAGNSNIHQSFHVNNALQGVSTLAVVTTGLHAIPAPTCGLASGLHCTLPLDGSTKSIKLHLRKHGHWHSQRQVVQCPWTGCPAILRWMNIPRHIQSIHLGVRFRCFNCGKAYTRLEGLAVHTASLKCYVYLVLADAQCSQLFVAATIKRIE
ncbi:hypothetical protein L210DRAFT_3511939 [Boletus edulis BED1]|uniref:C2H2-type domain-containing protein n=1 Tax=Boletus edulis BED1 TaxID=1328754 RepID=A0AAD4BAR5_BOLED|nr:hypothetical protein L210DRAFT_3511939 [Boletus edulis BED1]